MAMVSGWDKSPGPDNDYTGPAPTKRDILRTVILIGLIVVGFTAIIMLSRQS